MSELINSEAEQIKKIREIIKKLIHDKRLKRNQLANYLNLERKQYSSFYKFIAGDPFPKFMEAITGKILESLEKLFENSDLLQNLKEPRAQEENSGYGIPPISVLVWIPFDQKLPVVDYNGINPPLSIIQIIKKKGIIAFRNTSKYEADGEIYIDHIGMATEIEPGTKLAIKRIDKRDWKTDRYYVIIDASDQINIWELLPGDDKKTVRYISTKAPEGPHMELPFDRIVAIFTIVDGTCIPKPKRNNVIVSTSH